jgi:N-acyl-D-amino-acid deacylase
MNMRTSLLVLCIGLLIGAKAAPAQEVDLLIRGGRIVDGTGNPSFLGDVAIRGNRIVAIGHLSSTVAKRVLEANGLAVAPGFIDIHNHSDYSLIADGDAQSMIRQGVTSMILGEGESAGPIGGLQTASFRRVLVGGGTPDWIDFTGYFARLLRQGISTNVGSYVGSSQIWTYVRGERAGPPTAEELDQMQGLVRESMQEGALGVSSSLSGPPGSWIDTNTLVAMCQAASPYGGSYSTHLRTEGLGVFESVAEAIDIARRANVPVDIIHLKIAEHSMWGQMPKLISVIARARSEGVQVQANVYPYRAGQNDLATIIPPWAHEGGADAMIARLKDPSLRPRIEREILHGIPGSGWYDHYTATGGWDGMLLVSLSNPQYRKFEGMRMNQVIAALNKPAIDALFELLEANGGSVPTVYFHHSEDDMRYALQQSFVSVGSDGTAVATEVLSAPATRILATTAPSLACSGVTFVKNMC